MRAKINSIEKRMGVSELGLQPVVNPLQFGFGAPALSHHRLVGNHHRPPAMQIKQGDRLRRARQQLEIFCSAQAVPIDDQRAVAIKEHGALRRGQ